MKIPAERRRLDRDGSHAQKNPESNAVIICAKFRKFFSSMLIKGGVRNETFDGDGACRKNSGGASRA